MQSPILFITGTDTGVGKTVLASVLAAHLAGTRARIAALKPVCSGGRADAIALRRAIGGALSLDEVNPWHFRAAMSPLLAARREDRKLTLATVTAHIRKIQKRFALTIVEGAGGLLSPLGEDFDSRDLIVSLRATPVVVCPNRLGAINQVRLVLDALPAGLGRRAQIVLVQPAKSDLTAGSNPKFLTELFGRHRIHALPRVRFTPRRTPIIDRATRRALEGLLGQIGNGA